MFFATPNPGTHFLTGIALSFSERISVTDFCADSFRTLVRNLLRYARTRHLAPQNFVVLRCVAYSLPHWSQLIMCNIIAKIKKNLRISKVLHIFAIERNYDATHHNHIRATPERWLFCFSSVFFEY